jgi:hypothetical protein
MSRTFKDSNRQIRVRGIRKDPPDLRRLARALIALAQAQAEAEAEAVDRQRQSSDASKPRKNAKADHNEPTTGDAA